MYVVSKQLYQQLDFWGLAFVYFAALGLWVTGSIPKELQVPKSQHKAPFYYDLFGKEYGGDT